MEWQETLSNKDARRSTKLTSNKGVGSFLRSPMKGPLSTTALLARLTEFGIHIATQCMMWRSQHSTRKLCQGGGGRRTRLLRRMQSPWCSLMWSMKSHKLQQKSTFLMQLPASTPRHQLPQPRPHQYHFVRDRVFVEKEIEVERVPSGQMGADMLTKHASVGVVRYNKKLVGMQ